LHRQLQAVAASCRGQSPSPEDRRNAALQAGCCRERRKRSETAAFLLAFGGADGRAGRGCDSPFVQAAAKPGMDLINLSLAQERRTKA